MLNTLEEWSIQITLNYIIFPLVSKRYVLWRAIYSLEHHRILFRITEILSRIGYAFIRISSHTL